MLVSVDGLSFVFKIQDTSIPVQRILVKIRVHSRVKQIVVLDLIQSRILVEHIQQRISLSASNVHHFLLVSIVL